MRIEEGTIFLMQLYIWFAVGKLLISLADYAISAGQGVMQKASLFQRAKLYKNFENACPSSLMRARVDRTTNFL